MRYERKPEHDRRIQRGDDFAGDAWLDKATGEIVYGGVGSDRNLLEAQRQNEIFYKARNTSIVDSNGRQIAIVLASNCTKKAAREMAAYCAQQMNHAERQNVFLDLGFAPKEAALLGIRADLMIHIEKAIRAKKWTQVEAAEVLDISQALVSDLMRGKWEKFSIDMLLSLAGSLGIKPKIQLGKPQRNA